jgi:GntR family transcriptional regulator
VIQLNYRDSKPIYEQVKEGIRKLVVSGAVGPDEKLPSVRELASKLAINPNTISRAYRDLEAEGYLYTVGGKGTFASAHKQVQDYRTGELLKKLDEVLEELHYLSVPPEVLKEHIDSIVAGEGEK